MKRAQTGALVIVVVSFLAACSSATDGTGESEVSEIAEVSRQSMGDEWPLTVEAGTLSCQGSGGIGEVVFTAEDGTRYSVNGLAKQTGKYEDIMSIWAEDPNLAGLKINMSPLLERGLALCE